jgi:hypothetical protein
MPTLFRAQALWHKGSESHVHVSVAFRIITSAGVAANLMSWRVGNLGSWGVGE